MAPIKKKANLGLVIQHPITKSTNKHSEYVIFIGFARHQWLREHVWMLRYKFISVFCVLMALLEIDP